jgi:Thioesterase domain
MRPIATQIAMKTGPPYRAATAGSDLHPVGQVPDLPACVFENVDVAYFPFSTIIKKHSFPVWFITGVPLSPLSTLDEIISAPGRGRATSARVDEHLQSTMKRLKKLGVRPGACVASALPDGPDSTTAEMAAKLAHADFAPLTPHATVEKYQSILTGIEPKLLLAHSGAHPARDAARSLGIPVANVLRHFEAGIFTLEADIALPQPLSKHRARGVPVVLIAPGPAYRRLANRLDAVNPVVGITPPSLEQLPLPHTFEHIAAECVRILRRYRPQGPYALAGWRIDALVALEMARLLEEEGEKVVFVAMLDASSLFDSRPISLLRRAMKLLRRQYAPPCDFMAEALSRYNPRPWFGKILHLRPSAAEHPATGHLNWRSIAPQGIANYEAPNIHTVATILAAELVRSRVPPSRSFL